MTSVARVSGYNIAGRALAAVISMAGRHLFSIIAGIVVARGLGPAQFGNFMFLLAGFMTLHSLLDLSTSQAFFTSICGRSWPIRLHRWYGIWVALQFVLPFLVIWVVLPDSTVAGIWRGQARGLVLMAFAASYSQRVLWQLVTQVYEAHRLTVRVQLAAMGIMASHLVAVVVFKELGLLTPPILFVAITAEFASTGGVLLLLLRRQAEADSAEVSAEIIREFTAYMVPLVLPLFLSSANSFAETWLLQIFGGSEQQAFFSVAQQYANIGLVFGFPAVNVFWKEIAAAHARRDDISLHRIYTNGTRVLFVAPALVAGFCVCFANPVIGVLLGPAYAEAGPVFAVTLVNSIFQCFGLIVSLIFLATGRTRAYSIYTILLVAASLPGSFVVLWGLKLGALGLAIKLTLISIIFQVGNDWYNCRLYGWKPDNMFRIVVLLALFSVGAVCRLVILWLVSAQGALLQLVAGLTLYLALVIPGALYAVYALGYGARITELKSMLLAKTLQCRSGDPD